MQNQRRPFVCKRCGAYIDTRRRRSGGSLQCPECGMIYRPRPTQNQALQPQTQITKRQPQRMKKQWSKKKILGLVAILLLLFIMMGSCGNGNEDNVENNMHLEAAQQVDSSTAQPTQKPTQAPTQTPTQVPTKEPSLFPQTIFNQNGVKISITGFDKYSLMGPEIKITVENNSGMNLYLVTGELYCDGWQLSDFTGLFELANGSKAADTIYVYSSTLEDCGLKVSDLKEVTFKNARINNNDNYSQEFNFEMTAKLQ